MEKLTLLLTLITTIRAQDLDYPLRIERPRYVNSGDKDIDLKCYLGRGKTLLQDECQWQRSDIVYQANLVNGQVKDSDGNVVDQFEAFTNEDKTLCGIRIKNMNQDDFGEWSCLLNQSPFQKGTFHMLTAEMSHVRDVRLPKHVVPINFQLLLVPHIKVGDFTIDGRVNMTFEYKEGQDYSSKKIVLHSKEIAIHEETVQVFNHNQERYQIIGHEYDIEREFYIIHTAQDLTSLGQMSASLDFTAVLNDLLVGFYRSSYPTSNGQTRYLAATQFAWTDARRAFPCMDEPNVKATFDIQVGRTRNMTAISNMKLTTTQDHPQLQDYVVDTFETSLKMSAYLVAILISDFEITVTELDKTFKIWYVPGKSSQAEIAADAGPEILEYYVDYFGVPYPLEKTDMAALPDHKFGAMENWGLITYKESGLLYEENVSSLTNRERVIELVAHELAHMWFGNLVTMEWWTDLWLNEGFASYVEDIGKDFYDPKIDSRNRAVLRDLHDVFGIDALESSMAISVEVDNPLYDMTFNRLSYGKGNCLIRMIENFITLESFNKGITQYLKKFAFDNANRKDLWSCLNDAAKEDQTLDSNLTVGEIMETWTTQAGYPVISVVNTNEMELTLNQKRFFLNPEANPIKKTFWYVPINFAYPDGKSRSTQPSLWMWQSDENIQVKITSKPYIINVKETGYYRVNYDAENWRSLVKVMAQNPNSIETLNRAQIIDDSFNLARAGQLDYETPLNLIEHLGQETQYIPLKAALNNLDYIDLMFRQNENNYQYLKDFVKGLLIFRYEELGFEIDNDDDYTDILTQVSVINAMCQYDHPDCIQEALEMFDDWKSESDPDSNNPIHPDLKDVVYEVGARKEGYDAWSFLWSRLENTNVAAERTKLLTAMGKSEEENILIKYLNLTITPGSEIRKQDTIYVYRSIGSTDMGRKIQFEWLETQFESILNYFGNSLPSYIDDMLQGYTSAANTQGEIDRLESFLESNRGDLGGAVAIVEQGIDQAKTNLKWMDRNYQTILDWLVEQSGPVGAADCIRIGYVMYLFLGILFLLWH